MKRIHYIIPLTLLTLVGCTDEREDAVNEVPAGGKTIAFTLSSLSGTAEATRATRAVDDVAAEATVHTLDVFLFSADGNTRLFYPDSTASQLAIDRSTSTVTLTIPDETYNRWLGDSCRIFLLANAPLGRADLEQLTTLDAIKNRVVANEGTWLFNQTTAPARFLMTGQTSVKIEERDSQDFGTVTLERAAAKIVVDISNASVTGYLPVEAHVRLTNYLDKTKIGKEFLYEAVGADYGEPARKTLTQKIVDNRYAYTMDAENALYTYANDWRQNPNRETYITLEVDWMPLMEGGVERTYYYRLPFSYIDAGEEAEEHKGRILRNHIYQFMVDVSQLGGLDPAEAVELQANFDVIDWSDRTVDVSILSYHYLFVYNSRMEIHRIPSYEWEYKSSLPVAFDITRAECTEYYVDGTSDRIEYAPGEPPYPRITTRTDPETGRTYFSVNSVVPQNYVPLHLGVKVSNAAHLFSDVELVIYPEQYVTVSYSDPVNPTGGTFPQAGAYDGSDTSGENNQHGTNYPNGPGGVNNLNFYKITTTQLEDREIWIGNELRRISIGDPAILRSEHPFRNIDEYYETDPDLNHIVSPEFVMASRRGATSDLTWTQAVNRCRRYRESQYPAVTWRVPTYAELAVISVMQRDENSAIKDLLSESSGVTYWWTALRGYQIRPGAYTFGSRAGDGSDPAAVRANGANVPVRCVHDTWRNEYYSN